jgi:ribosomal protein S11
MDKRTTRKEESTRLNSKNKNKNSSMEFFLNWSKRLELAGKTRATSQEKNGQRKALLRQTEGSRSKPSGIKRTQNMTNRGGVEKGKTLPQVIELGIGKRPSQIKARKASRVTQQVKGRLGRLGRLRRRPRPSAGLKKKQWPIMEKERVSVKSELDAKLYIAEVRNNIRLTLTTTTGNVITTASGGMLGIKGKKRVTSYAGQAICKKIVQKIQDTNIENVIVVLKGSTLTLGQGLFGTVRELCESEIASKITLIINLTSRPYNGCRAVNRRRV